MYVIKAYNLMTFVQISAAELILSSLSDFKDKFTCDYYEFVIIIPTEVTKQIHKFASIIRNQVKPVA